MARLPQLVEVLGKYDTRGTPAIEHIGRLIRQAGYIQTSKRGRGASEMTAADAAALILGVHISDSPAQCIEKMPLFAKLRARDLPQIPRGVVPEVITLISAKRDLISAVACAIENVPQLEDLWSLTHARLSARTNSLKLKPVPTPEEATWPDLYFNLEITMAQPEHFAQVSLSWVGEGGLDSVTVHYEGVVDCKHGDRRVRTAFGIQTLRRVHRVLFGS